MIHLHRLGRKQNLPKVALLVLCVVLVSGIGTALLVRSHASTSTASTESEDGSNSSCAASVTDSSASSDHAIKFTSCSPAAAGLDESGNTIPDTNYPVPSANVVFISPSGNDGAAGTKAAPLASLTAAISKVPAGGTIVARGGTTMGTAAVYREGNLSTAKVFTLQPYPHEKVWFDGTVTVTSGWTNDGSGHWYTTWATPTFCGGKYYDMPYNAQTTPTCSWGSPGGKAGDYGSGAHAAATDPQLVYINGNYVNEVTSLGGVDGTHFFYDQDITNNTGRIYVGQNPGSVTVQIAKYPTLLKVEGGAGGNIIRGVGMRRYATDAYVSKTQAALVINVPNTTVENDVFTQMAGGGLGVVDTRNSVVRSSVFAYNGYNGYNATGHSTSGSYATNPDNLLVEDNVFNMSNNEGYGCGYACGISGMKFNHMNGGIVRNNIFESTQNAGKGFWCDENCNHMTIVNNIARNNASHGLFYEISDSAIIASNLMYGNGGYGLKFSAANTKLYNNTMINNSAGNMQFYDDARDPDGSKQGPNTASNAMFNNIFYTDNSTGTYEIQFLKNDTSAEQFFTGFDYNFYYRSGAKPANLLVWPTANSTTNYPTLAAFKAATAYEDHGQDISTGSDPFFVNAAAKDYSVRAGSVAKSGCSALPANVAAAIGVAASAGTQCGVLRVYPNGSL